MNQETKNKIIEEFSEKFDFSVKEKWCFVIGYSQAEEAVREEIREWAEKNYKEEILDEDAEWKIHYAGYNEALQDLLTKLTPNKK